MNPRIVKYYEDILLSYESNELTYFPESTLLFNYRYGDGIESSLGDYIEKYSFPNGRTKELYQLKYIF